MRVRIGALANATGIVQRMLDAQRCVIVMDGVEQGVCVIIDSGALEMADPLAS